ncbi:PucR family transcriptional regulator [Pseudonocardia humida]|uniref:Helix-turn-helix domain-containing protein n=1 Tax=Pseudonocardia humida TaxID=2800819 RepID=A0ABT0ZY98_9PSEU|nr:helix-turn-helix domain-containing protein [Pseudonocardia humida]MCO1655691.1 helix-turn-helix domain-containing protein [Pseudonocardia humida]
MHPSGLDLGALVAGLHEERETIGRRFAQLLRSVAPEYYAIDASDFQDAGWSALSVVVDGALLAVDEGSHAGFPVELVAESVAAARNGLPWEVLDRTYHLTHQAVWESVIGVLTALRRPRPEEASLLRTVSGRLFSYFDHLTSNAGRVYAQAEREQDGRRDDRIRGLVVQVLDGGSVPEVELGYRLGRTHVAVVAWGSDDARATLSAVARELATDALIVPAGEDLTWAWFAVDEVATEAALRSALDAAPTGRFALGAPAAGAPGFVTGHQQARQAASVWARKLTAPTGSALGYVDIAFRAVALDNEATARTFAEHELRPLQAAGARTAELTDTVTAYSRSGLNTRLTAKALGIAERTVRYRLDRLEALLGPGFRTRLPELVLAIALADSLTVQQRSRNPREV